MGFKFLVQFFKGADEATTRYGVQNPVHPLDIHLCDSCDRMHPVWEPQFFRPLECIFVGHLRISSLIKYLPPRCCKELREGKPPLPRETVMPLGAYSTI